MPRQQKAYRKDIDGLRGVSILLVVLYHAFPSFFHGGFIGVDVFFVISGYLITNIIRSQLDAGTFSLADFYGRRIRRIFPALSVVLIACIGFGWVGLLVKEYEHLGKHVAAGAGFVSNILLWKESGYFDSEITSKPLAHLWSLGIEEQFYIIWPAVLILIYKFDKRLRIVTAFISVSFAVNVITIPTDPTAAFLSPFGRFWELMTTYLFIGLTCRHADATPLSGRAVAEAACLVGVASIVAGCLLIDEHSAFPGWPALLPTLGAALIILAGPGCRFNRFVLSTPILVWVGQISFPLYLWHWPLLSFSHILHGGEPPFAMRVSAIALSVGLSWATFLWVERPLRFSRHPRRTAIALALTMIGLAAAGGAISFSHGFVKRPICVANGERASSAVFRSNPAFPCPNYQDREHCTLFTTPTAGKKLVVWGDSSAGMWLPPILDLAVDHDIAVFVIGYAACPPILEARKTTFESSGIREYCAAGTLQGRVFDYIEGLHPDAVILTAAWNAYNPHVEGENVVHKKFITDRSGETADARSTLRTMNERLPETIRRLSENTGHVLVFKSWPFLPTLPDYGIVRIPGPWSGKNETIRPDTHEFYKDREFVESIFDGIRNDHVSYFDPALMACGSGCAARRDGLRLYVDRYHITAEGAMLYREALWRALKPLLYP